MSEKRDFTASARVRVTVEVMNLGPYGADWKAGDIHDQVAREAQQKVQNLFGTCCKCGKERAHGHWLAWGTIPEKLLMSVEPGQHGRIHTLKGNRVRIKARLEPGKDNHFVFMRRPVGQLEMAV